ncbi:MAG: ABC transporter permease [Anaerolineae bacterium]
MKKIWLVTVQTYKRRIRSGTFLILTFGLPLLMIVAGAIPFLTAIGTPPASVGLVDLSGALVPPAQISLEDTTLQVDTFATQAAARAAYQAGDIGGYLVVPAGYLDGEQVAFYAQKSPGTTTNAALAELLRHSLLPDAPPWLLQRLSDPAQRVFVALDSGREVAEGPALILHFAAPAILAIFFAIAVLLGSSQMGAAVVQEKDQRSVEMLVTSLRVRELVFGKVLGVSLLTLTQFAIWGLGAAVGLGLALSSLVDIQGLIVPWPAIVWALLLGVPGYFLYGTLAAGLGVIAGDNQQARQLAGMLGFVAFVPFWFVGTMVEAPNGPAAIALSLFPLTSPMFSLLRMIIVEVPTWQLAVALALILLSLALSVWFVAHIFRAAMLNYGQSLRPEQILRALRQA